MRKSKSPRSKLIDELDKLWRSIGKENAFCEVCATLPVEERVNYSKLDPHHIVGRNNKLLRWDLKNRCWLCPTHHTFGKKNAQDNQGGWFFNDWTNEDWMGKNRLNDKIYLIDRRYKTRHWSLEELLEIKERLEKVKEGNQSDEYSDSIISSLSNVL